VEDLFEMLRIYESEDKKQAHIIISRTTSFGNAIKKLLSDFDITNSCRKGVFLYFSYTKFFIVSRSTSFFTYFYNTFKQTAWGRRKRVKAIHYN